MLECTVPQKQTALKKADQALYETILDTELTVEKLSDSSVLHQVPFPCLDSIRIPIDRFKVATDRSFTYMEEVSSENCLTQLKTCLSIVRLKS